MAGKKTKSGIDGKIAGLYDLEETIGQGHFAVVKLARHVFTGEKVAVKVIDKQKLDDMSRSHLFQEVRCMKLVQHPNVVRLYEVIDTQTKLYLILELGDGDMYDYIMRHDRGLDEQLAKKYFRQIVEAITYCHRLHVVHRDLKPENVVFFNKIGQVKLTDFGFSNVFAPGKKLETSCGSLAYSAPEILLGDSYDPPAVDVWSLGVILFMLVAGHAPFQEANDSETLTMIMDCKYLIPHHVSDLCRRLISKMLVREPSQRICLTDIENDPWLSLDESSDEHHSFSFPLLTHKHVSTEDHNHVVQKMVDGKICTREEIFQSLDRDAYDHIAATYYLLVERRLRKIQQQEAAVAQGGQKASLQGGATCSSKPHLEPLMLSPRKKQELRKMNTAPIHKTPSSGSYSPSGHPPTLVITPPILLEGPSGTATSPGGPDFVKSLTTSMTLDRRSHRKKLMPAQSPPATALPVVTATTASANNSSSRGGSPGSQNSTSVGGSPKTPSPTTLLNFRDDKKSPRVKSAPLTTSEGVKAVAGKKKSSGPSFSKIAILSAFFERKAAQERGTVPPSQPHQRLFPWIGGKDKKSKQMPVLSPASPNVQPLDSQYLRPPISGHDYTDPSNLVQSLVSPPGTHPSPVSASSPKTAVSHLLPDAFSLPRKCSLIHEESHEDEDDELDDFEMDSSELKPSKSLEFLDERISELSPMSSSDIGTLSPNKSSVSGGAGSYDPVNPRRPLKSVCSSPQLLNQIHEENESEDEDDFVPLKLSAPRGRYNHSGLASPEILRKYEQRRKRGGTGQRGTSCSSSDASDTDDTEGRSRKDKLKHKFVHRRDSSDHSSDTDGPSGGNTHGGGGRLGSGSNSGGGGGKTTGNRGSRRDGGGGGGGGNNGNGGGSGDKGGKSHSNSKQHYHHHHHTFCHSDSKSSSDDPLDFPVVNETNNNNNDVLLSEDFINLDVQVLHQTLPCEKKSSSLPLHTNARNANTTATTTTSQNNTTTTTTITNNSINNNNVIASTNNNNSDNNVRHNQLVRQKQVNCVPNSYDDILQETVTRKPRPDVNPPPSTSSFGGTDVATTTTITTTAPIPPSPVNDSSGSKPTQDTPNCDSLNNNNNHKNNVNTSYSSPDNGNSRSNSVNGFLGTFSVTPTPEHSRLQYVGPSSSFSLSHDLSSQEEAALEFSEISDFCDHFLEDHRCSGDCGMASLTSRNGNLNNNGIAPAMCKVGSRTPILQVESKCCSVV